MDSHASSVRIRTRTTRRRRGEGGVRRRLDVSDDGDDADVYGADDDMDFDALVDDIVEEMEAEDAAASADWNASIRATVIQSGGGGEEDDDDFDSGRRLRRR